MNRTIKVTEKQYNFIKEAIDNTYSYVDETDTVPYDGLTNVSVGGKRNGEKNADYNPTTDDFGKVNTPQSYWRRYKQQTAPYPHCVREGIDPSNDKDGDGVDDFYDQSDIDILSDGDESNELVRIPEGIDQRTDGLINMVKRLGLNPKQQAIILNKMIEELDIKDIPYSWKKILMRKINL